MLKIIPIPAATTKQQQSIINLVDTIVDVKSSDPNTNTEYWESEIDRLVYQLYGLTEEEIKIVEGNN